MTPIEPMFLFPVPGFIGTAKAWPGILHITFSCLFTPVFRFTGKKITLKR